MGCSAPAGSPRRRRRSRRKQNKVNDASVFHSGELSVPGIALPLSSAGATSSAHRTKKAVITMLAMRQREAGTSSRTPSTGHNGSAAACRESRCRGTGKRKLLARNQITGKSACTAAGRKAARPLHPPRNMTDRDAGHGDHVRVFRHEEHGELHRAVLGVISGDEFGLRFRRSNGIRLVSANAAIM